MEKSIKLKKQKRKRKHGFRRRISSRGGRLTIKRRKNKGRKRIAA